MAGLPDYMSYNRFRDAITVTSIYVGFIFGKYVRCGDVAYVTLFGIIIFQKIGGSYRVFGIGKK